MESLTTVLSLHGEWTVLLDVDTIYRYDRWVEKWNNAITLYHNLSLVRHTTGEYEGRVLIGQWQNN